MKNRNSNNFRRLVNDHKGVAEVFGAILLLAIVLPLASVFGLVFNNMVSDQVNMMNAQMDIMHRFTKYMDEMYFEFSPDNDNNPPVISNEYPVNGAVNVEFKPNCHVYVGDLDGDILRVSFFRYTSFDMAWDKAFKTLFCPSNTTVYWDYLYASNCNTTYYWYVAVYDGVTIVTSDIFGFTTMDVCPV